MALPQRKTARLKAYDYSQNGAYFVTICTQNRKCLLGEIVGNGLDRSDGTHCNPKMQLNHYGEMVQRDLIALPQHFPHITLDKYIIMPNHIHIIVMITQSGAAERSRPFPTLSTIIGLYKSGVSRKIGVPIWQKSFHDHVIRNEKAYEKIWEYIDTNVLKWEEDCYHVHWV